jgi:hypothetical protein
MTRHGPNHCARHNIDICSGLFHLEDALTGLKGVQDLFGAIKEYTALYFLLRPLLAEFEHAFDVLRREISDLMQHMRRMSRETGALLPCVYCQQVAVPQEWGLCATCTVVARAHRHRPPAGGGA